MARLITTAKKAFSNKVIHFIASRYATYLLQFVNSIFIAASLGPFYLGIWGFINLVVQYFAQLNLGIPHSANAIIAVEKGNEKLVLNVFGNSLTLITLVGLISFFFLEANVLFDWKIGFKYKFYEYTFWVALIVFFNYFISLFTNIFRIEGKLFEIAFSQTINPLLNILCLFLFKGEELLWSLVIANFMAFLSSVLLFLFKSPYKVNLMWDFQCLKNIQIKGWHLFVYNTSFYLIVITTRSFVSAYYSVSEFGFFTFAFTLANVILLLFQSFSSLIFPKVLYKFSKASIEEGKVILKKIRGNYISISHFFGHIAIMLFPFFLYFFPKYQSTLSSFRLIVLATLLSTNTFGYQGLLISKGKEKGLAILALLALILNIGIAYVFVALHVGYEYIIISTMISYYVYIYAISYVGSSMLGMKLSVFSLINEAFSISMLLPFIISVAMVILNMHNVWFCIPTFLFLILNRKNLMSVINTIRLTINNPEIINIQ